MVATVGPRDCPAVSQMFRSCYAGPDTPCASSRYRTDRLPDHASATPTYRPARAAVRGTARGLAGLRAHQQPVRPAADPGLGPGAGPDLGVRAVHRGLRRDP